MRLEIIFIRHGITEANRMGYVSGSQFDYPLCQEGEQELQRHYANGCYPDAPEVLFTSELIRTQQTCRIIFPGKAFIPLPILNERDFGPIEKQRDPEKIRQWREKLFCMGDTEQMWETGGESSRVFMLRIRQGIEQTVRMAVESGAKTVGIVGHGGYLKYFCRAFDIPEELITEQACVGNGEGAVFSCLYDGRKIKEIRFQSRIACL